jgi:hypothetical protein
MSRRKIVIDFGDPADRTLLHRIGNLQCELDGEFRKTGMAEVPDFERRDRAQILVSVTATRYIGDVMSTIESFLKRHNLDNLALIRR